MPNKLLLPLYRRLQIPVSSSFSHFSGLLRKHQNQAQQKIFRSLSVCQSRRSVLKNLKVLGIETSCDDTGAAIVDETGNILGDAIHKQTLTHLKTGGIIPSVAKEMHAEHIEDVVQEALNNAGLGFKDLDAIAVTVKPGLIMCLRIGLHHAQKLAHICRQQLIPIHHMEAHALTARMVNKISFPYLVLLTSGGHCQLAIARGVDDFLLLGTALDDAPGDVFDKTARELNLNMNPDLSTLCGGAALEKMAEKGDRTSFPPVYVKIKAASCNFSFSGLKTSAQILIQKEYKRQDIPKTDILPNAPDICAWFQYNVMYHLAKRVQRAFLFTELKGLISSDKKTLVMSGGVASNMYIRRCLQEVCEKYGYQLVCPPQPLCTDNGIMIAWNGVEKILSGKDCFHDPFSLKVEARASFGQDISMDLMNARIKPPVLKFTCS